MIKTRLVRLLAHARKYIVYQVLWQWAALWAQIVMIFTLTGTLDKILKNEWKGSEDLPRVLAIFLGVLALRILCDHGAAKASYLASADVKRVLRGKIYGKLLNLGVSYREQIATSEVVQLCTEGVEQLETYFGRYLPQLFYSLLAPLTLFIVLAFVNLKAALVLLICVPLIPISIVAVQKFAKKLLSKYWGIYTGLGDSFLENLQGLTTLKIYQADEKKAREMDEESQRFRQITMKVLTMQLNSTSVMDIVAYGGAAVGMIVASLEFLKGHLSFAGALTIILLASEFFIPLRLLGSFFHIAMNGMAASDKIFHLLDLPEPEHGTKTLKGDALDITLSDVHFSYEEDREILKGIDLSIPSGCFVALVGTSGCGKSTIAGLLSGKNKVQKGEIRIGNRRIEELSEAELLKNVTLIRHNSYLFKGTVRDNLKMAKPEASEKEMITALEKVNLWEFLKGQQGLDTPLAERAGNLSGGQCQRLALARALLHDSAVYIFDEATSNIDAESEEMIMAVIHELAKMRTVLLISHRLFNVIQANAIYMLKDGKIIEKGTHPELLQTDGAYAAIYESQMQLERYGETGGAV